jgi:hypothetical protein
LGRPLHDPTIQALAESLHSLGFRQASEPLRVGIKPPAALVPFMHQEQPAWATVYRTGTLPAKVGFDFVSILEGKEGGLTTLNNPQGAVLPAAPGSLRQVFPGAPPERAFAEHCAALAQLGKRGIVFQRPAVPAFASLFCKSSARQRAAFLRSPLRHTLAILWRLLTKDNPHLGSVFGQREAESQIRLLARRA